MGGPTLFHPFLQQTCLERTLSILGTRQQQGTDTPVLEQFAGYSRRRTKKGTKTSPGGRADTLASGAQRNPERGVTNCGAGREGFPKESSPNGALFKTDMSQRQRECTQRPGIQEAEARWTPGTRCVPRRSQCLPNSSCSHFSSGAGAAGVVGCSPTVPEKTLLFIALKSSLASHTPSVSEPFSHLLL